MKHTLLAAALLLAGPALAQTETTTPLKNANTIVVHTTDSASVAYRKIAGILLNSGYTIDRSDKDLLFLNTKSRPAPRYNMEHVVRASIVPTATGSDIKLRDAFTLPGAAAVSAIMAGQQETVYRGGPNTTFMICWGEIQRVAALYPNAKLGYTTQ